MAPNSVTSGKPDSTNLVPTVGLEIHARLLTEAKLFCACANSYGQRPNRLTCPVCLGLPGTLPVLNRAAVDLAVRTGLALGCTVEPVSEFARKNYFYPDLPRNYQITQYEHPLCTSGEMTVAFADRVGETLRVELERIHLEEDAGRSRRVGNGTVQLDLNRAGTPLIEIVTRPDLRSGAEASAWLKRLRQVLLYLGTCDGNLAEGSLRCDANVGLMPVDGAASTEVHPAARPWTELKNLNSFRAVSRGIDYEVQRLRRRMVEGRPLRHETRSWNDDLGRTEFLRRKETSADYRYFPEPDLPPLRLAVATIAAQRRRLPELPADRERRFQERFGLAHNEATELCATSELADYFEQVMAELELSQASLAGNWLRTEVLAAAATAGLPVAELALSPGSLAGLLKLIADGSVSGAGAKRIFEQMLLRGATIDPGDLVREMGLAQISDDAVLTTWSLSVLESYPGEVRAFQAGKARVLDFLIGQVMALSKGRANPRRVRSVLLQLLKDRADSS